MPASDRDGSPIRHAVSKLHKKNNRNLFTLSPLHISLHGLDWNGEAILHSTTQDHLALRIRVATLLVSQAHLDLLLRKAGFRPDQPRVPAGNPDGGQWTDEGYGSFTGSRSSGRQDRPFHISDDDVPKIPDHPPLRPRDRYAIARFVFRRMPLGRAALTAWRIYELANDTFSYFDEPKTLEELQRAVKEPKSGYDIHHIVEQTPAGAMDIRMPG